MIRSAVAAAAAFAATLIFGVGAAGAAPHSGTPLTRVAAHDGLSVPAPLAHAIAKKLSLAPAAGAAADSQGSSQQQQKLQAGDRDGNLDLFGITVSLTADGHTALVGAPGRTVGAAYVFVNHAGTWSQTQELESPAGSAEDSYGWSVALAGDGATALVGAYTGNNLSGIVYSYVRQGGKYVKSGQITHPTGRPGTRSAPRSRCRGSATSQ